MILITTPHCFPGHPFFPPPPPCQLGDEARGPWRPIRGVLVSREFIRLGPGRRPPVGASAAYPNHSNAVARASHRSAGTNDIPTLDLRRPLSALGRANNGHHHFAAWCRVPFLCHPTSFSATTDGVLRLRFDDSVGRPSLGIGSPSPARLLEILGGRPFSPETRQSVGRRPCRSPSISSLGPEPLDTESPSVSSCETDGPVSPSHS